MCLRGRTGAHLRAQDIRRQVEAIHAFLIARGNEDYADATARGN